MKKAAVIPSKGIGDALLMMIASEHLLNAGYEVTTYHPALKELQNWFPGHQFAPFSFEALSSYDLIVAENDNSSIIDSLRSHFSSFEKSDSPGPILSLFYPTYSSHRHPPLSLFDRAFASKKTMAENIALSIASLLNLPSDPLLSKHNGLRVPQGLMHRTYSKRVALHVTSSIVHKNWHCSRFLKLSACLKKKGFSPVFVLSPDERESWSDNLENTPLFPTLDHLARFLYESGYVIGNDSLVGHLASNLKIPTLIIANDRRRMHLWRPGWTKGEVVTPSSWIPNVKLLRLRERFWKSFISTRRVVSTFETLVASQK